MKYKLSLLAFGLLMANSASAATAVNLQHQPAAYLQKHLAVQKTALTPTRTYLDFNQTAHVRIQQTYAGIPVWNATGVIHTPHAASSNAHSLLKNTTAETSMNGVIYEGLEKDLNNTPAFALSDTQKNKAVQIAKATYSKKTGMPAISFTKDSAKKIIFIDDNQQARFAWLVSFYADDHAMGAHRPATIIDATTLNVYRTWDQVMTISNPLESKEGKAAIAKLQEGEGELYEITAGGVSGNEKSGDIIHDGMTDNQPALNIVAEDFTYESLPGKAETMTICALMTNDIVVTDVSYGDRPAYTACVKIPNMHNGVAWMSMDKNLTRWQSDVMNGGFSPSIDAFSAATLIKNFYQDWYNIPALVQEDGSTPMQMVMRVHYGRSFDNAFWDGEVMTFGDGGKLFYPLTSIGVSAHEISHGFTSQHSSISGEFPQMAALHEAFSDMAAVAVEYYHTKNVKWEIGREIKKGEGALRYLDNPTKDGRSIDNLKDFDNTEAHGGAGVFNKAFYFIATTNGWDIQKAFNIMVKANMNYWTSSMQTMPEAACGVLAATRDYNYNLSDVRVAFTKVGIDTDLCEVH